MRAYWIIVAASCAAAPIHTGEGPIYQPAPSWVKKADPSQDAASATAMSLADLRGIVLSHLGRKPEAEADFAIARRLFPNIAADYARYDVRP